MFATRLHWSNSPKAKKMWTGCSIINTAKHLYPYSCINLTKPSIAQNLRFFSFKFWNTENKLLNGFKVSCSLYLTFIWAIMEKSKRANKGVPIRSNKLVFFVLTQKIRICNILNLMLNFVNKDIKLIKCWLNILISVFLILFLISYLSITIIIYLKPYFDPLL